ncbi:hypothetical protein [Photobacterium sanguinicancri]|uniref:Lipoprotein n=1 Tax=Photobacterium sanguinicancri TaxID=875932 RepID=A0AAW7Y8Z3_9GAMM|nr:hypothetical protein [Photobacterium sanguinicancri]KXI21795.1 hypothetical protein AS132_17785 [Photobacterium sanguinicancri]MDO6543333.1 hypothetical protein [Photobacterium sanguinicancri]OZS43628.1 hypothetical protein ASV53_12205 [Photobacterium sanguinicancri]
MKKYALCLSAVLLAGCSTAKLTPPPSDFIGTVPSNYEQDLIALNDVPASPFRGGNMTFQYDPTNALLTVVVQLQNARWSWNFDPRSLKKDLFPQACENYEAPLSEGMGLRYWYAGSGGFTTEVLTHQSCQTYIKLNK